MKTRLGQQLENKFEKILQIFNKKYDIIKHLVYIHCLQIQIC